MTKNPSVAPARSANMFWRLFFKCFLKIGGPLAVLIALHFLVDGIPHISHGAWIIRIILFLGPIALVSSIYAWMRILDAEDPTGAPDMPGTHPGQNPPAGRHSP